MTSVFFSRMPMHSSSLLSVLTKKSSGNLMARRFSPLLMPRASFHSTAFHRNSIPSSVPPTKTDAAFIQREEQFLERVKIIFKKGRNTDNFTQLAACEQTKQNLDQSLILRGAWRAVFSYRKSEGLKNVFPNLKFSNSSWESLEQAIMCEKVENLAFTHLSFIDRGTAGDKIASLFPLLDPKDKNENEFQKLKTLSLINCDLTDADAINFAQILENQSEMIEKKKYPLLHLDLSENHIGWPGLKALGNSKLGLKSLYKGPHIRLTRNKIPTAEIVGTNSVTGFKTSHAQVYPWFTLDYTKGDD